MGDRGDAGARTIDDQPRVAPQPPVLDAPLSRRSGAALAESPAPRPQPTKMASNPVLREFVQTRLDWKWSPEQISNQLKLDFPTEEVMRVSPETISRSIFVQARGSRKREVEVKLRTGRVIRKPRKQAAGDARHKPRIPGMVMISERPAEVDDRAVPGHWESQCLCQAVVSIGISAGSW